MMRMQVFSILLAACTTTIGGSSAPDAGSSEEDSGSDDGSGSDAGGDDDEGDWGTPIFRSGWDNTTELGCNFTALIDGVWGDYGGSTACSGTVHDADVVNDVRFDGTRSLRVTQKPGGINGTDFRIGQVFGDRAALTIVGWVYYAPNYHWASADHKIFITLNAQQTEQNVYINYRGGSDPKHARLCAYSRPIDTLYCAPQPQVTVGTWYRIRTRIVAGVNGSIRVWLKQQGQPEVELTFVDENGNPFAFNNVNTGALGGFKYDTTYNLGASITENMYQYVDAIEVYP